MTDGYSAWRSLQGATHLGCMAHARRRFVEAQKTRGRNGGLPDQALQFFQRLYKVEANAQQAPLRAGESRADCIHRFRQQHGLPVTPPDSPDVASSDAILAPSAFHRMYLRVSFLVGALPCRSYPSAGSGPFRQKA
jgi:hypothetical protein